MKRRSCFGGSIPTNEPAMADGQRAPSASNGKSEHETEDGQRHRRLETRIRSKAPHMRGFHLPSDRAGNGQKRRLPSIKPTPQRVSPRNSRSSEEPRRPPWPPTGEKSRPLPSHLDAFPPPPSSPSPTGAARLSCNGTCGSGRRRSDSKTETFGFSPKRPRAPTSAAGPPEPSRHARSAPVAPVTPEKRLAGRGC